MNNRFVNPVTIVFGKSCLSELPARTAGKRVLLITSPGSKKRGLHQQITALCPPPAFSIDSVSSHTDLKYLNQMQSSLARIDFDCIVAVGGGSVIDTAKVLSLRSSPKELSAILNGQLKNKAIHSVPIIAIPTTCGSGSDVTPWATIWDIEAQKKHSLHLPSLFPEASLINPDFCFSLPLGQVVISTLDALSHAFEALWNRNANEVSTALAQSAIMQIIEILPRVLDGEPRYAELSLAALQAGLAFSNTQTAIAHALSYYITLAKKVPHGLACSFSLPAILHSVLEQDPAFAAILPFKEQTASRLLTFYKHIGIASAPHRYGLNKTDIPTLRATIADSPRSANFCYDSDAVIQQLFL